MAIKTFTFEPGSTIELDEDNMTVKVIGSLRPQGLPDKPENLSLVEVTDAFVSIAWSAVPGAFSYAVYRDGSPYATPAGPSYIDNVVDPDTVYEYQVRAVNAGGQSALSDILSVETLTPATPAVPTGLALTSATFNGAAIQWNNSVDAVEWDVFRNSVYLDTVQTPGYIDTGLAPSSTYNYQVLARNSAGDSALTAALVVNTLINSAPIWGVVPDQSGTVGNAYSLLLTPFCDDPEDQPMTFSILSGSVPGITISSNGQSLVGAFTTGGGHSIVVRASDGFASADTTINFTVAATPDVTAPTVPQNQLATANGSTVTLTWTPSTDAESGVRRYRVRFDGAFLSFADGPPFPHAGVADGAHAYTISAEDNAGNISANSSVANVTVITAPPAPDTPINFLATPFSATRIDLSWAPGPSGATPTDYDVDFSTVGPSGPWTPLPVTGTGTTFSHNMLSQQQYWYRLRANNGAVSSGYAAATAAPTGGPQTADFIIEGDASSFDCRNALPVTGLPKRQVRPGEIVQFNERPAGGTDLVNGSVFEIQYPEGTAAQPIRFVPQANKQIIFRGSSLVSGKFLFQVTGPGGATVSAVDREKYGYITIDGSTTSASVPTSARDGRKHGFRWVPFNGNDNPTNMIKQKGFIKFLTVKRCHMDWLGGNVHSGGIAANESTFKRTDYPGVYRKGIRVTDCLLEGCDVYLGSNYSTGALPHQEYVLDGTYFYKGPQTPILLKNGWGGGDNVHHNICIDSGNDQTDQGAIQRNSVSMTACNGEFHHNWIQNTAQGVPGLSVNNNVYACRFSMNDGPPKVAAQGYPAFPNGSIVLKVYDNIIVKGIETAIQCNSSGSGPPNNYTTAEICWYTVHIFNNTIDEFTNQKAVDFGSMASGSFVRNNIITRCATNPLDGSNVPAADVARNFISSSVAGVFVDATATPRENRDYHLSAARAVYGGSVLGTDVATSDYGTAVGASLVATDDRTISSVSGADMGAYQYYP